MTSYRYPSESVVFWVTILLVIGVIVFTSAATLCLSGLFILVMFVLAYLMNRQHHMELMQDSMGVSSTSAPNLFQIITDCAKRLHPGRLEAFVTPKNELNAYTFGISDPKTVVIYSAVLQIMDEDEIAFVVGHEMGHIALGHTWLNTILGGIAGIPASYGASAILALVFRSWNRMCEYSADRAGVLACGKPDKAISALLKLVSGKKTLTQADMGRLLQLVDQEDDSLAGQLNEMLSDHPMTIKRIEQIKKYIRTREYVDLARHIQANA
jgi:Zn-dependent protease with chaperone function